MDDVIPIAARAYEIDRYLAALLAPRPIRSDLITLAAFAGDVARIATTISEPMIGHIRLQWWRQALEDDAPTGNPIADALRAAIHRHGLPIALCLGVVDAEEGEVGANHPEDAEQRRTYLAKRDGALFELAWQIHAHRDGLTSDIHASPLNVLADAGQVYGRTRQLVELAARAAEGRLPIPREDLAHAGLAPEDLEPPAAPPAALMALLAVERAQIRIGWQQIRRDWRSYPHAIRAALLPLALVEPYLSAQEQLGSDCLRRVAEISPLTRVTRLWWANRFTPR